ncbi:MAG: hypothetical protein ACUVTD_08540 [Nitrososphaerales archaeon]
MSRIYEIAGPQQIELNQLVDLMAEILGKKGKRKIHIPLFIVKPIIKLSEWFFSNPVITSGELELLLRDYICDVSTTLKAFDIKLTPLRDALEKSLI